MTVIVDYGVGNLFSLQSSFSAIGESVTVSGDAETVKKADKLILPGVGAFADAAKKLRSGGLDALVCEKAKSGTPLLGICLGMQLLFEKSFEYGEHKRLGLIKGCVKPLEGYVPKYLNIPQIGCYSLEFKHGKHPIFKYINKGDFVYCVHSFFASDCENDLIATTEYGKQVTAAVANSNVCGCQFHPEKSGKVGLAILKGFCEWDGAE